VDPDNLVCAEITMKHFFAFALAVGMSAAYAQSGIIGGPFSTSGFYDTIPGGTFEINDPLTGWIGNGTVSSVPTPAMREERVGLVTAPYNGYYAVHRDVNTLVFGETYVLSGYFRSDDLGGSVAMDIGNFGGQAWYPVATVFNQIDTNTVGKWFFGYTTFTADNPSMRVRLFRNPTTALNARNYFDDVAVTRASEFVAPTAVPEPATMAVMGAGALLIIRRRSVNKRASRI
jgi:hypothetical protein